MRYLGYLLTVIIVILFFSLPLKTFAIESPTPSPSPSPTPTETPTSSPSATPTSVPTGTPSASPTVTPTPSPTPLIFTGYKGEYFNNTNLAGLPVLVRDDPTIQFDWGSGSPDPVVHNDLFSVRWTKTVNVTQGMYLFNTVSDDGVRLYVDNILVINQWNDHAATLFKGYKYLEAGSHTIRMEYFEDHGGAVAKFSFGLAPTPNSNWQAQYFNNQILSGVPDLARQDPFINFVWNDGSPDPLINNDNFSARWTKQELKRAGKYSFTLKSDDGIRFWINNTLIIDDWTNHATRTYTPDVFLQDGLYNLKVEYFENTGGAVAILNEDFPARDRVVPTPIPIP